MDKAREKIQGQMIPKGPHVIRHLALPTEGCSLEWIEAEMNTMDSEMAGAASWRLGKLSGAVYRAYSLVLKTQVNLILTGVRRRRR